jgi:hypothetical protein
MHFLCAQFRYFALKIHVTVENDREKSWRSRLRGPRRKDKTRRSLGVDEKQMDRGADTLRANRHEGFQLRKVFRFFGQLRRAKLITS